MRAAICQADPILSKKVFASQADLPEFLQGKRTCLILESTFNARLGGMTGEWEEWLKTH
jgi:hypothetical protein